MILATIGRNFAYFYLNTMKSNGITRISTSFYYVEVFRNKKNVLSCVTCVVTTVYGLVLENILYSN